MKEEMTYSTAGNERRPMYLEHRGQGDSVHTFRELYADSHMKC
jgi:hypothetical protein